MELLLIRYSEIGLKSAPVRRRFENQLRSNMMSMLAQDNIEAIITTGSGRFYVESNDLEKAAHSLRRVFGIASLSRAAVCSSSMEEICSTSAEYSKGKINKGQRFRVSARREGTHDYSSMEVAKEAGSAIFLANEDLKVDLHDPEVTFFIEVRNNKAYIFSEYLQCYAGLPLGSQGKVIAEVNNERGLLSAWLMMKRGCKAIVYGNYDATLLKRYDTSFKKLSEEEANAVKALGFVSGAAIDEVESIDVSGNLPVYFPTVGMTDEEVKRKISEIF